MIKNQTNPSQTSPTSLSIGVFCSASNKVDKKFLLQAYNLGLTLADRKIRVLYGGASVGSMGMVADGALKGHGEVVGVLPKLLFDRELAHTGLNELIVTENMHERKQYIYENSQAIIALPGGFGTLDEVFETLTWNQLGIHKKPVIFFDEHGFYQSLNHFVSEAKKQSFTSVYDDTSASFLSSQEDLSLWLEKVTLDHEKGR